MTTYSYQALDAQGRETKGTLQVETQAEALQRIKEMGFFPVKITEQSAKPLSPAARANRHAARLKLTSRLTPRASRLPVLSAGTTTSGARSGPNTNG